MKINKFENRNQKAFTRLDAAAISVMLLLLFLVGLPIATGNTVTATGVTCTDNLRKLSLAWQLYADGSGEKLVNNFGIADTMGTVSDKSYLTWAHNIMDWTTNPSNTNLTLMAASKIYPYIQNPVRPFKCPADRYVSAQQTAAGWSNGRLRSYSMNGFMAPFSRNTSDSSYRGENPLAPQYRQFILSSSIAYPDRTFVFLDEHPDSINDGYFFNMPGNSTQWGDLPASFHNGAAGFSFADGHVEIHAWQFPSTKQPVRFAYSGAAIPSTQRGDYLWLTSRMTVTHPTLAVARGNDAAKVIWTPTTSTYRLQSSPSVTEPDWTTVGEQPVRASGQTAVTTPAGGTDRYFRLIRP